MRLRLFIFSFILIALPSSARALPDAPVAKTIANGIGNDIGIGIAKPQSRTHKFYDKWGKIEFGAALTVAATDSGITCHNLANGGREVWQPSQSCAGNVAILFGGVAAQEGVAYVFHRLGWHKPERLVRAFTIQASTRGILYSAQHGGI